MEPAKPGVVTWYKAYCGVMVALYLMCIAFSLVFFLVDHQELEMSQAEATMMGLLLLVLGLVCMAVFALPFFLPRKPWVWIYGIVMIGLGMTSPCLLPITIPLLIYWLKPDTKAYFGR